ncbi:MAG: Asp-tRNA(Asn)/Glu-tRNA(Gln) amidotransferase subunit GatB [Victivallales bacterium]|nr:Asp-tRNA(Asn)/Glu-tRNA(Gln) amidotransferase subunit GatB [Victivallales bacterium]
MKYEAVIGLEVHTELNTQTKIFCGCRNQFGAEPNTNVCPVCLGYPGSLPVMNREAIRKTIIAGLMCGCEIAPYSKWDRKNYYYPDMPKNYQISQFDLPICLGGVVPIAGKGFSGELLDERDIGITRIHLEEDVAKSTHLGKFSGVDFNRAGVPLMEIVSEPDMHTPDEAYAYLVALKQAMEYAGVSDCDMEKGQMRCDVNVSVRPVGQVELGTKIEIKNLNSFRSAHRSLEYEIERQIEELEDGGRMFQETRRWDDAAGMTTVMRTKESAHDYRYFPDPDLMPVEVSAEWLEELRGGLAETPYARRDRFVAEYAVTPYDAHVLTLEQVTADYFEVAAQGRKSAKMVANWIQTELLGAISKGGHTLAESPVPAEALSELVGLIEANTISGKIAKDVFAEMLENGRSAKAIVKDKGLEQVTDTGAIEGMVDAAIAANPKPVAEYQEGNKKAVQFLVGQVMKASRGKANPQMVVQLLKQRLDG